MDQWNIVQLLNHVQLFVTPWTISRQAPLCKEFPRQEYWSGLLFPSSGDLPDPGVKPTFPAWQADSLPLSHMGMKWSIPMECYWNGILLSKKKKKKERERDHLSIYSNMDESREHYAMWNVRQRKTNTIWSHLYIESKKQNENIQIQRTNIWFPEGRGLVELQNRWRRLRGTNLQLYNK